ncbi:MAG: tetratricopeptide repeat-containing sensor histidine kinase [Ignavibacteria bacterium]|jgi:signal transduction histidine kinase
MKAISSNIFFILFILLIQTQAQSQFDSIANSITDLDKTSKAESLLDKMWEERSNNPLLAIQLGNEARKICREINNKSLEAKAANFLGVVYTNMGANENALSLHESALKLAKESKDSIQIAYSYNNVGGIYRLKNDVTNSLENIQKAISIFEAQNERRGLAYCYINIGRLYKDQNNYENSYKYFNDALELVKSINGEDMEARILLDIANLSLESGDNKKAIESFKELEEKYKKLNYLKGLAEVWTGYSMLYYKNGGYGLALNHALNALRLHRQISNINGEINTLNHISSIHLKKKNFLQSKNYLDTAFKKVKEINDAPLLAELNNSYYNFYKEQNDYPTALKFYEAYNKIKDSIYTNEEMTRLVELESLIKIERSEKEKHLLQTDLDNQIRQRKFFLLTGVLLLAIIITLFVGYKEKKKLNEELETSNRIKDKIFKIISNDLREPCNAIFGSVDLLKNHYNELTEREKRESIESIGRSVKSSFALLDNLLAWSKAQKKELLYKPSQIGLKEIIRSTLELAEQSIRRKNISVTVNIQENYKIFADQQMIYTIIRNLLFNSIKFTNQNGSIDLLAKQKGVLDIIEIKDDGIGMDNETVKDIFSLNKKVSARGNSEENGSGIGLILCKEFIDYHNGSIEVKSTKGIGTKFSIVLPRNLI